MKRLYVVYGPDDRPFAECEKLRDAFWQMKECYDNNGGPVSIDVYFWAGNKGYKYECAYGDFYFIDRKGEAILPEDLEELGVYWFNLFYFENEREIDRIKGLALTCEIQFNDIAKDVYKQLYPIKKSKG